MKKYYLLLIFFLVSVTNYAQIKGTVSDDKGIHCFVTVFQEDTYNGTTSMRWVNTNKPKKLKNKPLSFSFRIQKHKKIAVQTDKLPYTFDVKMIEESFSLNEVVINPKINPAIIKMQLPKEKKKNSSLPCRFYSRDFQTKKCTKKDIGSKIGDLNGSLDSTGTGIISLSETFSKITFENPII
jgi:hypothetical protein